MLEAKQLSLSYLCPVPSSSDRSCEIEKLFKRKECSTVDELKSFEQDEDAIHVEGFLIGARIIPDELKPQYYWDVLLDFGRSRKDLAQTCSIISFLVRKGNSTKLSLCDIFDTLQDSIWMSDPMSHNISDLNDVMTLCFDYLSTSAKDHEDSTINEPAVSMLINAAICSRGEHFESLTTSVVRILKLVIQTETSWKRKGFKYTFGYPAWSAWTMIDILRDKIGEGMLEEVEEDAIYHIKHAFFRLLSLNDTSREKKSKV